MAPENLANAPRLLAVESSLSVNTTGAQQNVASAQAPAPTGAKFVRKSLKYLVPHEALGVLKAQLAKKLTISPFTLKTGEVLTTQQTNSSYFDNSTLDMYHGRVLKAEGAKLVRLRWYGPSLKTSAICMERKVHHEDMSGKESNKKRFRIELKDIESYLEGKDCPEVPNEKDSKLPRQIQRVVVENQLVPKVHTQYYRTSYFQKDDDSVRITLDEDVRVYRETGLWNDLVRTDGKPVGRPSCMPFSIIEVKLKCAGSEITMPAWLESLLTDRVQAIKLKISKYNYGCSMLYPHLCHTVPAWIGFVQNPFEGVDFTPTLTSTRSDTSVRKPTPAGLPEVASDFVDLEGSVSSSGLPARRPSLAHRIQSSVNIFGRDKKGEQTLPIQGSSSSATFPIVRVPLKKPAQGATWDPKAFLANERTFAHWVRLSLSLCIFTIGLSELGGMGSEVKIILMLIACNFMIVYSTTMFHLRRRGLLSRITDPSIVHPAFNDWLGNSLLALIIFIFVTTYLICLLVFGGSFHNESSDMSGVLVTGP